jgi:hypothetical protein
MIRQSLEFMTTPGLPAYRETNAFEYGKHYVFRKAENAEEPRENARALRRFDYLGHAMEWARKNLGADAFVVARKA